MNLEAQRKDDTMAIIRFAIDNPVKVSVGVILLLLFGSLSFFIIPIQLTPNVDKPVLTIKTVWPGASPQEIEREIVDRQEEKLKGVSNLREMTSKSTEGRAEVVLEFHVGTAKETALREVSDKLRQVTDYPIEVDEPTIEASDASINSPIAWLMFTAPADEDPATLLDFVEDKVKPILERADGVASVDIYGGREREVQIRVDPRKMAAMGVTFRELEAILHGQNENISAGTISSGKRDYTWRTIGQYETLEQVEETVIAQRPGGPVYVRDIAEVVASHKKAYSFVRSTGTPVLALPVRRETGANVIEVMAELKRQIQRVNEYILAPRGRAGPEPTGLGKGYRLRQVYDETIYIEAAINRVQSNLLYGGILAMVVLMLFLRSPSATAIVSLCIPISVVGAFLVVTMLGRTLNVIMLAGMVFAVGMVVDNSIVVLENIYRHRQMGKRRRQAALDGAVEVWGAVLASTMTTMVVFLPVIFLEDEAGQLFRDIAIAIASAVGLSLVIAMTVIPTVAGRYLRTAKRRTIQPSRVTNAVAGLVHAVNGSFIARATICLLMVTGSLYGSYLLKAPTDYLPSGNRNLVFGYLITPPGYAMSEFRRMGETIEETVHPYWSVQAGSPQAEAMAQAWRARVIPVLEDQVDAARARLAAAAQSKPGTDASLVDQRAIEAARGGLEMARERLRAYSVPPPPVANFFYVAWGGFCFMGATSQDHQVVKPLINLLTEAGQKVPGTMAIFTQTSLFDSVRGTGNSIELEIRGDDIEEVVSAAEATFMKCRNRFERVRPEPANFDLGRPEIRIIPDRERSAEVGLNVRDVGQIVEACVNGAFVAGGFREHGDEIDLAILVQDMEDATPEDIGHVPVYTPTGRIVTLGSVVDIVRTTAPQQINHIEEMPAVTLVINPPDDMPLQQATDIVEIQLIPELRLSGAVPDSVFISAAGNARRLDQTRTALFGQWSGFNARSLSRLVTSRGFLAVLITYLLMAALFESFVFPMVIMFSVIPATVGGFAGLAIVHRLSELDPVLPTQKLDVLTMLGFVVLVGIVVNNAILIVHQALNNMQHHGMPARQAITESVRSRIRPIFMTAMTSVGGMLPLVVMPGAGSELYRGLGSVVVGGLLVSTLFTLLLVPALFSLFVDLRQMIRPTALATGFKPAINA